MVTSQVGIETDGSHHHFARDFCFFHVAERESARARARERERERERE